MSLLTISEVAAIAGNDNDEENGSLAAGLSLALERACNRRFPSKVSDLETNAVDTVTLWVPRHRLRAGDVVQVTTMPAGDLEGYHVVVEAQRDSFTIALEIADVSCLEASVRKVEEQVISTKGGVTLSVLHLPLADVYELAYAAQDGTWTDYQASDYVVTDKIGGVSFSGEIALLTKCFPVRAAGSRVRYIAGEPWPLPDLEYAMSGLIAAARRRMRGSGLQSENLDYYSYSKLSAAEIGKLFGDADRIIRENRLSAV